MSFNKATLFATAGNTLMLPNYKGYFKWDYSQNRLYFQNEDYKTYDIGEDVKKRKDWYYIV